MVSKIKDRWVKVGCIGQIMIICSVCVFIFALDSYIQKQLFLQPISERLDVKDWAEFETYLKTTYVEGMTREAVYQELEAFGEYKITTIGKMRSGKYCEIIGLPTGKPVVFHHLEYWVCFSRNDKLTDWRLYD